MDFAYDDDVFMNGRACLGLNLEVFYPERGNRYTKAATVCASCPVIELCAHYFLADETPAYVAGMTPDQRAQRRKDLQRKTA